MPLQRTAGGVVRVASRSEMRRLQKAFELGVTARALFEHGLRRRFPGLDGAALCRLVRERLDRCHNRNY
jgi:hypothetical protein